jgi:hypothetical protein
MPEEKFPWTDTHGSFCNLWKALFQTSKKIGNPQVKPGKIWPDNTHEMVRNQVLGLSGSWINT